MSLFSIQTGHEVPKEGQPILSKVLPILGHGIPRELHLTEVFRRGDILPSLRNPNQQGSFTNCDLK